jgi:hypothetical protein
LVVGWVVRWWLMVGGWLGLGVGGWVAVVGGGWWWLVVWLGVDVWLLVGWWAPKHNRTTRAVARRAAWRGVACGVAWRGVGRGVA